MSLPHGRRVALSPARRLVVDLMWACRGVPLVAVDRRIDLSELVAARQTAPVRPMWTVIFAKAFATVAAGEPVLRQSFIGFPWAHLYEHAEPVTAVTVQREDGGVPVVFTTRLRRAHARPLTDLDAELRHAKGGPAEAVAAIRRARRLARLPRPLRRAALWLGLHASGRLRERNAGTFAVTSVAAEGGGALQPLSPLTATVHYGLFDAAGRLDLRLTFDHRVFDGATAARALVAMERVLNGALLAELRRPAERNPQHGTETNEAVPIQTLHDGPRV